MSDFEELIPNRNDDPIRVCVEGDVVSINTNRYDGREYEGNAVMTLPMARLLHAALGRVIEHATSNGFTAEANLDLYASDPVQTWPSGTLILQPVEWFSPAFVPNHDCLDKDRRLIYRAGCRYALPENTTTFNLIAVSPNGRPHDGFEDAPMI